MSSIEMILSPSAKIKAPCSRIPFYVCSKASTHSIGKSILPNKPNVISWNNNLHHTKKSPRLLALHTGNCYESGSESITQHGLENLPLSVELQPISDESQFDRVVSEEAVVILWMANWCRKCIYLKPKLEKLAADYYPRVRFYSVDVNNIPHKLVVRAGVTKMPTIQLWKYGQKQSEVIGGHKAYLVVNEVREMIENEDGL